MIVKVENEENYVLKVGDIVRICDDFYIVRQQDNVFATPMKRNQYILRGILDDLGLDGYYETLESLTESLEGEGAIVYKASEYDLLLSKKK